MGRNVDIGLRLVESVRSLLVLVLVTLPCPAFCTEPDDDKEDDVSVAAAGAN